MKKLVPILALLCAFGTQKAAAQPGRWYSYYDYLDVTSGVDVRFTNMWNDTTSVQHEYSSFDGDYYYTEKFTSMGMSFAPRLSGWDATWSIPSAIIKIGPTDVFAIDSVKVYGKYARNLSKSASLRDTLRLAFVSGDGSAPSNLPSASMTSASGFSVDYLSMFYDNVKNKAGKNTTGATPYTQDIILKNTDTAVFFNKSLALTTPFFVPAGEFASMSFSFKTGDPAWTPGDTVEYLTGNHKYGAFHPLIMFASTTPGYVDWPVYSPADSNVGHFRRSVPATSGWMPYYIPTWAWSNGSGGPSWLQYPAVDFHITCPTCRLADDIVGIYSMCEGATTTYTHSAAGGSWSSSTPTVATIGATSGVVTGVGGGTTTITYTVGSNFTTRELTIDPIPSPTLTGSTSVCVGNTITLTSSSFMGGTWTSTSTGVATVIPITFSDGKVTGVSTGTTTISFEESNWCGTGATTMTITVETLPDAGTLNGDDNICLNSTTTITPSIAGGTWSTSNSNAFVSGGAVSGVAVGLSIVTYTVTNMCGTSTVQKLMNIVICPTGVGNVSNEANISVAPNPTNDEINISSATKINSLIIYDVAGQKVFSGSYNSRNVNVSMKELPAGIYTVRVNDDKVYRVVRQ